MFLFVVKKTLTVFCSLVIIVSFGMHAVQVKHQHYDVLHSADTHNDTTQGAHSGDFESLGEKMHMVEKKFVSFMISVPVLFFGFVFLQIVSYERILLRRYLRTRSGQKIRQFMVNSHIYLSYASGLLNPKLY